MLQIMRTTVFVLGFFISGVCSAHWGGYHGGGYYHGGYHGGGYYHGGYYHGGYHGGYYGGGWGGTGITIGVPFGGYYAPACQTVRVCNNYGHCWLQQSCD